MLSPSRFERARRIGCAGVIGVAVWLCAPCAQAQDVTTLTRYAYPPVAAAAPTFWPGLASEPRVARLQAAPVRRERSVRRKVFGAIVGGAGGFFGGFFLGAAIEGDRCNCDDPGFVGALIGAPVGAATGAVLGYEFLFR